MNAILHPRSRPRCVQCVRLHLVRRHEGEGGGEEACEAERGGRAGHQARAVGSGGKRRTGPAAGKKGGWRTVICAAARSPSGVLAKTRGRVTTPHGAAG
jgi:hypothetical protein